MLLSDFHREQAWERWLSQPANGVMPHRDAVLLHLRRLAHAMSADQFEKALEELEESDVWRCTYGKTFRNWFEKTWLSLKEVTTTISNFNPQSLSLIEIVATGKQVLAIGVATDMCIGRKNFAFK